MLLSEAIDNNKLLMDTEGLTKAKSGPYRFEKTTDAIREAYLN